MSSLLVKQSLNSKIDNALTKLSKTLLDLKIKDVIHASPAYLRQYKHMHKMVSQLPGNDLLDWGAGYGHFSFVQATLGKKVTAYSPVGDDYTIYTSDLEKLAR